MPFFELAAYAGYPFVAACASLLVQLVTGELWWWGGWGGVGGGGCAGRGGPGCEWKLSAAPVLTATHSIVSLLLPLAHSVPAPAARPRTLPAGSGAAYHVVWAYGSLCAAIFLVRSMKRVIFHEARTYSERASSQRGGGGWTGRRLAGESVPAGTAWPGGPGG